MADRGRPAAAGHDGKGWRRSRPWAEARARDTGSSANHWRVPMEDQAWAKDEENRGRSMADWGRPAGARHGGMGWHRSRPWAEALKRDTSFFGSWRAPREDQAWTKAPSSSSNQCCPPRRLMVPITQIHAAETHSQQLQIVQDASFAELKAKRLKLKQDACFAELKAERLKLNERLIPTTEWIRRAKEDPAKWIHSKMQSLFRRSLRAIERSRPQQNKEKEQVFSTSYDAADTLFRIPSHLIFSRLPVRQLFQLRLVCKAWKVVLQGPPQTIICGEQPEEHWFIMSQPLPYGERVWNFRSFSSLDRTDTTFGLPLPSSSHRKLLTLLGGMHCSLLPRFEHLKYSGCCRPRLVSAGGLMCAFVHRQDALDDYFVIVFNCLTGSVRVLPPLLNSTYLSEVPCHATRIGCFTYMSVDGQDPSRYYVMLTHEEVILRGYNGLYFEIFDSRRGSWRVACSIDSATFADSSAKVSLADFFFVAYNAEAEASLLAYHAAHDLWSKVLLPGRGSSYMKERGLCPTFSKHKGRLLQCLPLISDPTLETDYTLLGFIVWELQLVPPKPAVWVEVARTPQHLWQGFCCLDWSQRVLAEGDVFCMTFEEEYFEGHYRPPLVYDIARDLWYVLPGSTDFGCILVHRPRLSMLASPLEEEGCSNCSENITPLPT